MEHYTALRYTFTSESRYKLRLKVRNARWPGRAACRRGASSARPGTSPRPQPPQRARTRRGRRTPGRGHLPTNKVLSSGTNFRLLSVFLSKFRKYCIGIEMREQRLAKYLFDLSHDEISNQKWCVSNPIYSQPQLQMYTAPAQTSRVIIVYLAR